MSTRPSDGVRRASGSPGAPPASRLSLRFRVLIGYLVMLLVFGGVLIAVLVEMQQTGTALTAITRGYLPLAREIGAARSSPLGLELETLASPERLWQVRRLEQRILTGLEGQISRAADIAGALGRADLTSGDAEVLDSVLLDLAAVQEGLASYRDAHDRLVAAVDAGDPSAPLLVEELVAQRRSVEDGLGRAGRRVQNRMSRVLSRTQSSQRSAGIAVSVFSGVAFGIGVLLLLATNWMMFPIRRLISSAERLRQGAWNEPLPVTSTDEVGRLARAFNAMADSIVERERKLAERGAELEAALAELRQSQAALIRSERLATIGQMAAQIAHEVRNPLNALGLNAECLVDEIADGEVEAAREIVEAIQAEVTRLVNITESYLALGRAPPLRLEPFPLPQLVHDLVRFQQQEAEQQGVAIGIELDELPDVLADANQLRQALLNILRNAVEALGEGGSVTLRGDVDDGMVRLRIADDGPGMHAEQVARIFDPFYSTKESGSGLGLPLTQQVISEHGGRIACMSTPGGGTTFSIWLPVAR